MDKASIIAASGTTWRAPEPLFSHWWQVPTTTRILGWAHAVDVIHLSRSVRGHKSSYNGCAHFLVISAEDMLENTSNEDLLDDLWTKCTIEPLSKDDLGALLLAIHSIVDDECAVVDLDAFVCGFRIVGAGSLQIAVWETADAFGCLIGAYLDLV